MAEAVYVLCGLTSITCAALLFRGYHQGRWRLLLWGALCFTGLAVNNLLLFVDLIVVPDVDLAIVRSLTALVSVGLLLFGMIWEAR